MRLQSSKRFAVAAAAAVAVGSLTALATPAAQAQSPTADRVVAQKAAVQKAANHKPRKHKHPRRSPYTLTVLHNNDGESQLISAPDQADYGGIARFASLVDQERAAALEGKGRRGVVLLSSGDNYLAGPEFNASLSKGAPYYDSLGLARIGYDAFALGNHEFDFGPENLATFITSFGTPPKFVSANLDFTGEPSLQALVEQGTIVKRHVVWEKGEPIGIVGATTPALASISSPGDVEVLQDVAGIVQRQVNALTRRGVNKIILISHLQSVEEDRALVPMLRGVDVAIAGGGDELLANEGDALVPGDSISLDPTTGEPLSYPLTATGGDGATVPIVTTAGDYKYLGKLVVKFNPRGKLLSVGDDSGPLRVSGVEDDAVEPDAWIQENVVDPVQAYVDDLAANVVGTSQVALEGRRDPGVRSEETNLGNLMADSLLWTAQQKAAEYGLDAPVIGLQNGGGIRNNSLIPPGPITELNTFEIAAFSNFVSIVPDFPRAQLKELLENAVSKLPVADGRFAQVAGFSFTYDLIGTPMVIEEDGTVSQVGTRVQDVTLDDGTVIVQDGEVVDGPGISIATIDFSVRQDGDQWPFRGAPFTTVGVTYQQALANYISDGLGGLITAADYPEGGEGRITPVP
ncbi:bifunctional metallophosphatase/5'-nucleotidase [Nocardioides sp. GY 10113]|uniref:bifunctional metallophosphatase/5'-nucleotidase n=1 Tax=Nocardioides sp. GY 10113 TaxID=2569761 RepID=UPI0010A913CD|nr:bifunctional metallophosphatase/5'-nucleotidase [Nocardioides sp. GY 10113]TIC88262.1 bifunctional metallophosphatase/5'-nucleotidase [Nocardioides sp. GY 10113]